MTPARALEQIPESGSPLQWPSSVARWAEWPLLGQVSGLTGASRYEHAEQYAREPLPALRALVGSFDSSHGL